MPTDLTSALEEQLRQQGISVLELPDETGTAEQAAAAVGAQVSQIVKSLLAIADGAPLMILAAGDRQVDLQLVARTMAISEIRMARAAAVKSITGFTIGGVPPLGFPQPIRTVMDERLLLRSLVYAAAGTRFRVFPVAPDMLRLLSSAVAVAVS